MGNKQTIFTEEQLDNYQVSSARPAPNAGPTALPFARSLAEASREPALPGSNPASAFGLPRDLGPVTSPRRASVSPPV